MVLARKACNDCGPQWWGSSACAPLAVFLLSSIDEQKPTRPAGVVWVAAIIALSIVGFGWWRASIYMPSGSAIETLLLWADNILSHPYKPARINDFVHQIGFGLFPFGALLPFALMGLLWLQRARQAASLISLHLDCRGICRTRTRCKL